MTQIDPEVQTGVLGILNELAEDWDHDGEITTDTKFVADLGLQSLDIVVLGTLLQQRYGKLPYAQFLDELGNRPVDERDLTVTQLAAFVTENRETQTQGA